MSGSPSESARCLVEPPSGPREPRTPSPPPSFPAPRRRISPILGSSLERPITNYAVIPGAPAMPASWSVGSFSAQLQREMEEKGLRTPLINSSQYLGSDEPPSGQFGEKERRSLCQVLGDCYRSYRKCTREVSESIVLVILYVVLMVFAVHATYMGFNNLEKCPWSKDLPPLYASLGICSLVALTTRTFYLFNRRYFPRLRIYIDRFLFSGAVSVFFILFLFQCLGYYLKRYEPTEEGETSCGQYFYNYVRVSNWCIPIVFVGMAILHGPTSFWMTAVPIACMDRFQ